MKRVAAEANAWLPVGIPLSGIAAMFDSIKNTAHQAGRDPSTLVLIVTAGVAIHERPIEKERPEFMETLEQIGEDFARARKLGVSGSRDQRAVFWGPGNQPKSSSPEWKISGR